MNNKELKRLSNYLSSALYVVAVIGVAIDANPQQIIIMMLMAIWFKL